MKEIYFDEELNKLVVLDEWSMKPSEDGAIMLTGHRARDLMEGGKVLSDRDRMTRANLSLLSEESAKISLKKIQRQISGLKNMTDELKNFEETAIGAHGDGSGAVLYEAKPNSVMTAVGLMRARQASFAENPLAGRDLDAADVRLESANDESGKMFQKLDAFLKDRIHKSLGLGGLWDNVQNITAA